jgi:hypothetical protein
MKYIMTITLAFAIISCNNVIDKTDINSVLEYGGNQILAKNFDSLLVLTEYSNAANEIEKIIERTRFHEIEDFLNNASNIRLLRASVKDDSKFIESRTINFKNVEYLLLMDGEYYKVTCRLDKSDSGYYFGNFIVNNLSKECNSYVFTPSTNNVISLDNSYWSKYSNRQFEEFYLRVKNKSEKNFIEFQYRLSLRDLSGYEFFNRVKTYIGKISPNELIDIRVEELDNYFTNFEINKNNFKRDFTIISVTTESNKASCELIESL